MVDRPRCFIVKPTTILKHLRRRIIVKVLVQNFARYYRNCLLNETIDWLSSKRQKECECKSLMLLQVSAKNDGVNKQTNRYKEDYG